MKIETGTPRTDARYLCFVPHDIKPEIAKPIVLIWSAGRWRFDESNVEFPRPPAGWVGPLPAGKLADIVPGIKDRDGYSVAAAKLADDIDAHIQEYDL